MGNALHILTNLIFLGGHTSCTFHSQENKELEKLNNISYNNSELEFKTRYSWFQRMNSTDTSSSGLLVKTQLGINFPLSFMGSKVKIERGLMDFFSLKESDYSIRKTITTRGLKSKRNSEVYIEIFNWQYSQMQYCIIQKQTQSFFE